MKIIMIGILLALIALEIRKLLISRKLNKMLILKQQQLRVKNEVEISLDKDKKNPYFGLNLRLAGTLVLMFALILMPDKKISPNLKDTLLNSVSLSENNVSTFSEVQTFRTASFMEEDYKDKTVIDGKLIYTLDYNKLKLTEMNGLTAHTVKEITITDYLADYILKEGQYLYVIGRVEKEEATNEALVEKLDDSFDTVIDIYDTSDYSHVNKLIFDGSIIDLNLHENQFTVITKNNLYYELIEQDYILPWYKSDTYSRDYNYDHLRYSDQTMSETIYNAYTYNIKDDFVQTYSLILSKDAVVTSLRNDLYFLADTVDGKTVIYKIGNKGEYVEEFASGTIDKYRDLYINRGSLYFITCQDDAIFLNKYDLNLEKAETIKLDTTNLGNYSFVDSMFVYGKKESNVIDLNTMKKSSILDNSNILFFDKVNDNTLIALVKENENYVVKLLETINGKINEVANYRIKTFENSLVEFTNYYEESGIFLVGVNRGNLDELMYVFEIGPLGIESISIHDVTELPNNIYTDACIIEQYLYLANNEEVLAVNLLNNHDKVRIDL